MTQVVTWITAGVTLCGFLAIWIRVGIYKGTSDTKQKETENRVARLEVRVDTMNEEKHAFEKEIVGIMSEVRTKLEFIFQGIAELKKKQEDSDA